MEVRKYKKKTLLFKQYQQIVQTSSIELIQTASSQSVTPNTARATCCKPLNYFTDFTGSECKRFYTKRSSGCGQHWRLGSPAPGKFQRFCNFTTGYMRRNWYREYNYDWERHWYVYVTFCPYAALFPTDPTQSLVNTITIKMAANTLAANQCCMAPKTTNTHRTSALSWRQSRHISIRQKH